VSSITQQVGGASAPLAAPEDVRFVPTPGAHISAAEAESFGTELYRLSKVEHVELTATNIVTRARSPKSPLHGWFTWNDEEAAALYREREARNLLNAISFRFSADPETDAAPMRFFAALASGDEDDPGEVNYYPMTIIHASEDLTEKLLATALRELSWFERKYKRLQALDSIVDWNALRRALRGVK
jgi:hypothetical protein